MLQVTLHFSRDRRFVIKAVFRRAAAAVFLALWPFLGAQIVRPADVITNHQALRAPLTPKPPAGAQFSDSVFGTRVIRLTNSRAENRPGLFPDYAKRQAWNADETRLLLRSDDGTVNLYDGKNYRFQKVLSAAAGEDIFWHPTNPEKLYYNPDRALYLLDVEREESSLIHEFAEFTFANTRGEGNLSRDGRYYAVAGQIYNPVTEEVRIRALLLFDLQEGREVSRLALPETLESFDWVSVSPLGNFVVVDYATTETARFQGVETYDRQFNLVWQKPLGAGHSDLAVDSAGDEVLVMDVYDEEQNLTIFKKIRLRDGAVTDLLAISPLFDQHISCRNEARPGWCWISTFDYVERLEDQTVPWLPFEDEIFALDLDGSGRVERLGHHHSRRYSTQFPDSDRSVYFAEPHATVSRTGTRVLFGSNWGENLGAVESVDAYVLDLGEAPAIRVSVESAQRLMMSWSAAEGVFELETRSSFDSGTVWQVAVERPVHTAGSNAVTVIPAEKAGFYRLRRK